MKVYLTYYRYDQGESYSVYNIDRSLQRSYTHWKEVDLPEFLGYGPDDVSQLYLIRCDLSKTDIEVLKESMDSPSDFDVEFDNLMDLIHEDVTEDDIICQTTGEECIEVLEWFQKYFRAFINPNNYWKEIPEDEDELNDELQQILFNDTSILERVLKVYIQDVY